MAWTKAARDAAALARKHHQVVYHGTHDGAKAGIKREGLKAGEWFKADPHVFVTSSKSAAKKYAFGAAKIAGKSPVIVTFSLPRKMKLEKDTASTKAQQAFSVKGGISRSRISEITTFVKSKYPVVEVKSKKKR